MYETISACDKDCQRDTGPLHNSLPPHASLGKNRAHPATARSTWLQRKAQISVLPQSRLSSPGRLVFPSYCWYPSLHWHRFVPSLVSSSAHLAIVGQLQSLSLRHSICSADPTSSAQAISNVDRHSDRQTDRQTDTHYNTLQPSRREK